MLFNSSEKISVLLGCLSPSDTAKRLFFFFTFIKILGYMVFVYSGAQFWTPVTDANLYDSIARGGVVHSHPWGGLLKTMNDYGLYSRTYLSAFIFMLNCTLVPWLVAKVCVGANQKMSAIDWYLLLAIAVYPTMTVFSADIFRDTPMVVLFLIFLLSVQHFLNQPLSQLHLKCSIGYALAALVSCYLIYTLRFYLAAALFAAFFASYVLDISRRPWFALILYFFGLLGADALGLFDELKGSYRLTYEGAGSGYGINFSEGFFLINFIQSFAYSVYGVYIKGALGFVVFLVESLPVVYLSYLLYSRKESANRFVIFLIYFFFIYGALWAIGVDSLGTAVRYRIFNYLAVLIAACLLFKRKSLIDLHGYAPNTNG
jgi:hypothetical protein